MKTSPNATKTLRRSRPKQSDGPPEMFYFIVCGTVYYARKDEITRIRERTVNTLLELSTPAIDKEALSRVQQSLVLRVAKENGLEPEEIKDTTILNISMLGRMTEEAFHGGTKS